MRLPQRTADIYDSYINANYINSSTSGQLDQKFIATQGPLPQTRENFWRLVWQENTRLIVMLCACKENKATKCDQYWPDVENEAYYFNNGFSVQRKDKVELAGPNLLKRTFELVFGEEGEEERREVTHLQYLTWPDHGAPEPEDNEIIGLILEAMREEFKREQQQEKIIVHCSAGIGRTGTIIAIFNIQLAMEQLAKFKL